MASTRPSVAPPPSLAENSIAPATGTAPPLSGSPRSIRFGQVSRAMTAHQPRSVSQPQNQPGRFRMARRLIAKASRGRGDRRAAREPARSPTPCECGFWLCARLSLPARRPTLPRSRAHDRAASSRTAGSRKCGSPWALRYRAVPSA
jgi:hypothetical protein